MLGTFAFFVLLPMIEKAKYPTYTASATYTTEAVPAKEGVPGNPAVYADPIVYTFDIDKDVVCGVDVPAEEYYTIDTPPDEYPHSQLEDEDSVAEMHPVGTDTSTLSAVESADASIGDEETFKCSEGYQLYPRFFDGETYTLTGEAVLIEPATPEEPGQPAIPSETFNETLQYDSYKDEWTATSNGESTTPTMLEKYDELQDDIEMQMKEDGVTPRE